MRQSVALTGIIILILSNSCNHSISKEERLARNYCGSCHLYPEPELLDKKSWEKVLPEMAFRMGFMDMNTLMKMSEEDQKIVIHALPEKKMLSDEELKSIENFYLARAPDSLPAPTSRIDSVARLFEAETHRLGAGETELTLIKNDTLHSNIYIGTRQSELFTLTYNLEIKDSLQLASPPADITSLDTDRRHVLLMGIMDPNEQSKGEVVTLDDQDHVRTVIGSIQRPVHFEKVDLNKDSHEDFVICAFGNYTGALLAYQGLPGGTFKKHQLLGVPGARKVIVKDFDNNGLPDILALMTQGDERIVLIYNQGDFNFRITTLLKFPPVYGSSYFDILDFNNDGKFDILYTNGDNADYSSILKPYHGVRIFLNDGTNGFKQSWFHPLHGASKALAADFDRDGDLDIAVISFFADFKDHPEQGFVYFKNDHDAFIPHVVPLGAAGRWIAMETIDLESDGDTDLLLGALNFPPAVPPPLVKQWKSEKVSLLVLRNKTFTPAFSRK